QLVADGVVFRSATDTEVIAQLIASHLNGDLVQAVSKTLALLKGTYGLAVVSPRQPDLVVGARLGSPLVVGVGDGEHFLASDPSALAGQTQRVVYLEDRELCVLTGDNFDVYDDADTRISATVQSIDWDAGDTDKGGFPHHMLKEIFEQPETVAAAMRGRLDEPDATAHFGGLNLDARQLRQAERILLTACGTSYHAGLVGEYLFEEFARMPVEV